MESFTNLLLDGTGLELLSFILLCAVSFVGSFITAAVGLGGGILVLATMALFINPAVLIKAMRVRPTQPFDIER